MLKSISDFRIKIGSGFFQSPLPVSPTSQTPSPPAFGPGNIAKYDLTLSCRRTTIHSGPVPVFSRIMTAKIRRLGENWYNRACMGLRCMYQDIRILPSHRLVQPVRIKIKISPLRKFRRGNQIPGQAGCRIPQGSRVLRQSPRTVFSGSGSAVRVQYHRIRVG